MKAPLNFGPSEQTREQRQEIANQAIKFHEEEERQATAELLKLYNHYIQGDIDLYSVRVHASEQSQERLKMLLEELGRTVGQ